MASSSIPWVVNAKRIPSATYGYDIRILLSLLKGFTLILILFECDQQTKKLKAYLVPNKRHSIERIEQFSRKLINNLRRRNSELIFTRLPLEDLKSKKLLMVSNSFFEKVSIRVSTRISIGNIIFVANRLNLSKGLIKRFLIFQ